MKRFSMDRDWFFIKGYKQERQPNRPEGAVRVDLPHDFTIGTDVDPASPNGPATGFYNGGIGTYTKDIDIPWEMLGRTMLLEIDGAYGYTEVIINGHLAAMHPYGYTPFHADLTPYIEAGMKNRLTVTVNNSAPLNSRWYTGSGLYRHVDLLTAEDVHLAPWPLFAWTAGIHDGVAHVDVEVTAVNRSGEAVNETVHVELVSEETGELEAAGSFALCIPAGGTAAGKACLTVADPSLWELEHPRLYMVKAMLGNRDADSALFGIRTLAVDSVNGLTLNGETIKLKGGCVHHGSGILGAAAFRDAEFRNMALHKRHGFNAVRCAHNPPSRDMLEACDRLGLLVMDEAFDMWRMAKNPNDYHLYFENWWRQDMEAFITRDRCHPCVFMWSTGNEIVERNGVSGGYALAGELADHVRKLDPTRPLTNAIPLGFNGLTDIDSQKRDENTGWNNTQNYLDKVWGPHTERFIAPLDVAGYNYLHKRYERDGQVFPGRVMCGTESFPMDAAAAWGEVEKLPFVIGDFTWTSMDYIGEAGIGRTARLAPAEAAALHPFQGTPVLYPWRLANDADMDLCGFDRPQLHYRKIVWGSAETYITVGRPEEPGIVEWVSPWGWPDVCAEWTYSGQEGKVFPVVVYTAAEETELFLNGASLGVLPAGKTHEFRAHFSVPYAPGTLSAVSRSGGQEVSRSELVTAGKAAKLRLSLEPHAFAAGMHPDASFLPSDGQTLAFVTAELVDAEGRRVPFEDMAAEASITGAGILAAFGNGRPVTAENYTSGRFTSFMGRWLAVVRAGYDAGEAVLRIKTDSGLAGSVTIAFKPEI